MFLIFAYTKLNNIKDELNIRLEIRAIIISWVVCSFLYFGTLQTETSFLDDDDDGNFVASVIIFVIIQTRNLSTVTISTFFCYKIIKNPTISYFKPDYPT